MFYLIIVICVSSRREPPKLARKRRLHILLYFSTFLAYRARMCNAGAAPCSGSGALLEQLAVRSEGRGSFAVDLGGYSGLPFPILTLYLRRVTAGQFSRTRRVVGTFLRRSLESSEHFQEFLHSSRLRRSHRKTMAHYTGRF